MKTTELLIASIFEAQFRQLAYESTIGHPDWLALDQGTIELSQAIENAQRRADLDTEKISEVYAQTPVHLAPAPGITALIGQLAQSFPLYVLSNMHLHSWDYLKSHHQFWKHFSGLLISSHERLLKPDQAIYQRLCERYNLDPAECVFFDDTQKNIDAAIEFGLHAIKIHSAQDAHLTIKHYLETRS